MFFNFFVCSILCLVIGEEEFLYVYDYGEGVECIIENEKTNGTCTSLLNCPWALDRIKQRQHVDVCTFNGKDPIVCCPLNESIVPDQSNSSVDSVVPIVRKEYSPADWTKQSDKCIVQHEGQQGTCISIRNCSWALTRIKQREKVDKCSFVGRNPIVCCPINEKFESGDLLSGNLDQSTVTQSSPIPKGSSSAWSEERCSEYYPRPEGIYTVGVGGELSLAQEFPHMAVLGYGREEEKEWGCGGSLITYQHVLTAAHCLESRDLGPVRYVRLGDLDIQSDTDIAGPQDFNVTSAIPHPDFDHLTLKHDIAILVLDRQAQITIYVKPGCLFPGGVIDEYVDITATGWGITEFAGQPSSHLVKVALEIVNNTDCRRQYRTAGSRGDIDDELQVCAGSAVEDKIIDTCEGDSGGPLQYTNYTNSKHYMIVGITSFGKACGITRSAGVYTRVSSHLPWIESVVLNNS